MKNLLLIVCTFCCLSLIGCADGHKRIAQKEVVTAPAEIDAKAPEIIEYSLKDAIGDSGKVLNYRLRDPEVVQYIYQAADFAPLWTKEGRWLPAADSLHTLIHESRRYGLLPEHYYESRLDSLKQLTTSDTASTENKLDASLWAQTELLFTGALVRMIKDLKLGRLQHDTIANKDQSLNAQFYLAQIDRFKTLSQDSFTVALEPKLRQYTELKEALQHFLEGANLKKYSYINIKDSLRLPINVARRLKEDTLYDHDPARYDSAYLSKAIRSWQRKKKLKEDGKLNAALVSNLNNNDYEKFLRIAINMDRLKGLPALPQQYIWVNIPAYQLQLFDADTVVLTSRVVVGKPQTATPQLTSALSDMITYPKWYIPQSIIKKEILPALKKDPGYLARKGYNLFDTAGNQIDPYTVDWARYEKGIPYSVVQGSGDANALGVLKFNFPNKYAVYLHDTNQRYLFSKDKRALSHGCVRVQSWLPLATYLLQRDSIMGAANAVPVDSMNTWLTQKIKKWIPLRNRMPLFIRYYTCEVKEGSVRFFEDVYGDDRRLRERYFKEN